jgi:exonuclease III
MLPPASLRAQLQVRQLQRQPKSLHLERCLPGNQRGLHGRVGPEAGLVDLWRRSNGPDACEWTWLSNQKNGFRIDHAFGNEPFVRLLQPACVYDHRSREGKTSDHSALIVTAI